MHDTNGGKNSAIYTIQLCFVLCAPIAHTLITNQVEVRISHFGSIYHCWTFPVINIGDYKISPQHVGQYLNSLPSNEAAFGRQKLSILHN
jgi:hypothetical protein